MPGKRGKAGIQARAHEFGGSGWIPAFAGMTKAGCLQCGLMPTRAEDVFKYVMPANA